MTTRPGAGILLLGSERFRRLGSETEDGSYEARISRAAGEIIGKLSRFIEPFFNGVIYTRGDVRKAIEYFHANRVDCVICAFLSWSEDRQWIAFLRDMYEAPLLLYVEDAAGPSFVNTRGQNDFLKFLVRGGLVGSLEASGSITRLNRSVQVVAGDFESSSKKIQSFANASMARAKLRESVFGLLASYNEAMWSTWVDPYKMFARIGPEVKFISYQRLKQEIEAMDERNVEAYAEKLASIYTVEEDVDFRLLRESARASLALDSLRAAFGLGALVLNDVDAELFELIGLRPGFYHDGFNENGAVLVPEGDLGAGAIACALKHMTGKHVNFAEPFYFNSAKNTFYAGHAGPQDHNDKNHRCLVRISRDLRFAKSPFKYAGAPFAWYRFPPGIKTFAHFSDSGESCKIICFNAESLEGAHELCSYSHSEFRAMTDAGGLFEKVLKTGATQHFALVEGDASEELSMFAAVNNFTFHKY